MSSSSSSDILGDLPPGIQFAPPDEQIVELYLLRRVRGRPDLFPGLIVDDDAVANTQPWELFDRHGRPDAPQAFFFVRTNGGARPDRRCRGGGTWKSQKREKEKPCHEMVVDGEAVKWSKHNLNLHMEKLESGSCGWVMHEYTVAGSSLKMCSISFTGNGQKRKRIPDGYGDEPVTQRPRVAAEGASGSGTTTATFDQGFFSTAHAYEHQELLHDSSDEEIAAEMVAEMTYAQPTSTWEFQAEDASGSGTTTFDQGFSTAHASEHQELLHDSSDEEIAAEMVAEMTYVVVQPSWEFQAEQQVPQTMNTSAPHEFQPPPPWTTTMTSSQESGLAQEDRAAHASEGLQHLADASEDIAAMIDEMTNADHFLDQVPFIGKASTSPSATTTTPCVDRV